MRTSLHFILAAFLGAALLFPAITLAGPGHDHDAEQSAHADHEDHQGHEHGGEEAQAEPGALYLTGTMIANLGIKTVAAVSQASAPMVSMTADVDYLPERQAIVGARAAGAVAQLMVTTGQAVKKGEPIAVIQPHFTGNPAITLTAPIDGFVTEQNIVLGQSVTPEQTLFRIADLSEVLLRGQAFEDMAQASIRAGQNVIVTTPAYPGETFTGRVQRADATFKPGTRIREILAIVKNSEGRLLANMQSTLSVAVGAPVSALVVPRRAVLGELGNYFVYVRDGELFRRRDVLLGSTFGPMQEIKGGIAEGEEIVTVGNYQLQFISPESGDEEAGHGHAH